ncbi:retrovirus-related pol polyprotein from transposon TNT 1-94 [Tanacetum coccineum]
MKAVFNQMETDVAKCSVDKKYFEIEKKELSLDYDHLLEHIICQDVMNVVMHANDHHDNVLPVNNNSLVHDNSALDRLKHENDRLMELLISQDLVHTTVNALAAINDYKSMEQSFVDEYEGNLKLQTELANKNDMIKKAVYNELSKRCSRLENRYLPPLSPCIKNNMAAHIDYLKHTQANDDILREIVKDDRELRPLDRVSCSTKASGSKPRSNTKNDKKKNKVEDHPRIAKSSLNSTNRVSKIVCNENVKHSVLNANFELVCATCNECMFDSIHGSCVHGYLVDVNARVKSKAVKPRNSKSKKKKTWKPTRKIYSSVGYKWVPKGRNFSIVGNACPLTRITSIKVLPPKKNIPPKPNANVPNLEIKVFHRSTKVAKAVKFNDTPSILGTKPSNNSEPMQNYGSNVSTSPSSSHVNFSKFLGTVRFGNDQIAKIMGYGDYQLGNVTISRVYCVEGVRHSLFSVGQLCDSDLEVAFRKHTCYVRTLNGVDLLSGSRDTNLYTISMDDMMKSSPIYLLSKASKTKSWLWHRRLSHLNFSTLNQLAKQGLVRGLPKLRFEKDHLSSACSLRKSKKSTHKPKADDTNQEKLYLLHMDLCGPIRVESINGKKYILVIVDDYSIFTSLIRLCYNKTPYELMHDKKLDLCYLHVFGSLCYPTNDNEDLGKLKAKAYIGIFVCYAPAKKAFRIYNKRTKLIIETIQVTFDELTTMASEQFSLGPAPQLMTLGTLSSGLVPNPIPQTPYVPPTNNDWDILFQPMFDEFFNPPPSVVYPVPVVAAPRPVDLTSSTVSTLIDQDATSAKSTSQVSSSNVRPSHTTVELLGRWTKNHQIKNVIRYPSRSFSTRKELKINAMWCYFDAFLTSVEPKNFKEAMLESSWIEAMQEEIHEFERLQVWELVPCSDPVMLIKLKWIFKVKKDECSGVLKNKA